MGVVRDPGEAPGEFARRVARKFPRLEQQVLDITDRYQALVYAPADSGDRDTDGSVAELGRRVRRFQFAKP
jgi:hypothetical protein